MGIDELRRDLLAKLDTTIETLHGQLRRAHKWRKAVAGAATSSELAQAAAMVVTDTSADEAPE